MGAFDDILKGIPEEERAFLTEKHPEIRQAVEGLETSLAQANSSLADTTRKVVEWEEFLYGKPDAKGVRSGGHYDPETKDFRSSVEAKKQLQEAQGRIAALEASVDAGGEMTFDEIVAGIKGQGFLPKSDVEALVKTAVTGFVPKDQVDDALNRMALGFQRLYTETAGLPNQHHREFGESLDMAKFFEFMAQNSGAGFQDPRGSYERFVGAKREELRKAAEQKRDQDHQAALETTKQAALKEGIEQGKREVTMSAQGSLPTDQLGAPPSLTPLAQEQLQKARQEDGTFKLPEGTKLGDGVRSAIAAQVLKEKGTLETVQ